MQGETLWSMKWVKALDQVDDNVMKQSTGQRYEKTRNRNCFQSRKFQRLITINLFAQKEYSMIIL